MNKQKKSLFCFLTKKLLFTKLCPKYWTNDIIGTEVLNNDESGNKLLFRVVGMSQTNVISDSLAMLLLRL